MNDEAKEVCQYYNMYRDVVGCTIHYITFITYIRMYEKGLKLNRTGEVF